MRLFILLLLLPLNLMAAQPAIVKASRAVVYADMKLQSPIGYLTRGKQIMVGKRKRLNDTVLPTVINRKVVWMKVEDLMLDSDSLTNTQNRTIREHVAFIQEEEISEEEKDPFLENNYLRIKYGSISPSIGEGDEGVGSGYSLTSEALTGSEFSFYMEHRHPLKRWNWGVGYQYSTFSSEIVEYTFPNFMVGTGYIFTKFDNLHLELIAHFLVSMDVRVNVSGVGEYRGSSYGAELGPLLRWRTYKKTGVVVSALLKRSRFINLKSIENPINNRLDHLSTLNEFALFAGLSFEL